MTSDARERMLAAYSCKPTDRMPFVIQIGWADAEKRWEAENHGDWSMGVRSDPDVKMVNIDFGPYPRFEAKEIGRDNEWVVRRTDWGILRRDSLIMPENMPEYLDYPVHNWDDWLILKKERFTNPQDTGRFTFFTPDWLAEIHKAREDGHLIQLGRYPYGIFGTLRELMGAERTLLAFYDQPELVHDIVNSLTDLWLEIWRRVTQSIKPDILHLWEDMAGRQGPLISPRMIREFMGPCYRRIKQFACEQGIPIMSVDTDGNCDALIPVFMELGVNHMYPFEVQAGCDVVRYRQEYPRLSMRGGIDKRCVAKGPAAIDAELARIESLAAIERNGYIPWPDHAIPPDAPWKNWVYFNQQLYAMIMRHVR